MSEIEPGTIQDLLAELVACAGVFDVSTNYEADKVSLEKATQAVLDYVQTLRDERDRLREALQPFAERWEYFERTKHPSGGEWPEDLEYADDEPSAIYLGQLKAAKAALTPAAAPLTPNEATE